MCFHCENCGYDSGDFETIKEIMNKVKMDGGELKHKVFPVEEDLMGIGLEGKCPKCKSEKDWQID